MPRPFRWNLQKREQLGRLVTGDAAESYPELLGDLRDSSARVVGLSADRPMVFVGRSPESIFDYLCGVLLDTTWSTRMTLVNLSLRDSPTGLSRASIEALHDQLRETPLAPVSIASSAVTLVDLVYTGETFGELTRLLFDWAREKELDVNSVRRQLRFVGITWRKPTSPKTWRWQQHAEWTRDFRPSAIKNVSIPGRLWDYLGNRQEKVTYSNPPWRWTEESLQAPPRNAKQLAALRLAVHLFDAGRTREERARFADRLAKERAMKEPWVRSLVAELR